MTRYYWEPVGPVKRAAVDQPIRHTNFQCASEGGVSAGRMDSVIGGKRRKPTASTRGLRGARATSSPSGSFIGPKPETAVAT